MVALAMSHPSSPVDYYEAECACSGSAQSSRLRERRYEGAVLMKTSTVIHAVCGCARRQPAISALLSYFAASAVSVRGLRRGGAFRAFLTAGSAAGTASAAADSAEAAGAGAAAASARHSAMPPVSPSLLETMVTSSGRSNAIFFALPPPI